MPTTVNLALLVGDIVNSRLDHAESTGTAPPYFEVGRLDPVDADPVLLRQLLENLIENSLRMTAPGVGPYLAISCQPAPNGMLRIDILDNSVGFPPGQRHEIWSNFHRDKGSAATGLELAICKRIVERHGGTIDAVANPYGTGTRMSFTLPAGRSAYARTLAPAR
jgi:signal transduction histidine kinase